jgi:hypothetical protein
LSSSKVPVEARAANVQKSPVLKTPVEELRVKVTAMPFSRTSEMALTGTGMSPLPMARVS